MKGLARKSRASERSGKSASASSGYPDISNTVMSGVAAGLRHPERRFTAIRDGYRVSGPLQDPVND